MIDSPVTVRPCTPDDVPLLTATEPAGSGLAERFFDLQQRGSVVFLVGRLDGEPVGTGVLTRAERPELKNLQVREEVRGRGVGAAMIAAAEQLAADLPGNNGRLVVGVADDNPSARRLYLRLGYAPTGRKDTVTYSYVDADGVRREATETSEDLEKLLR